MLGLFATAPFKPRVRGHDRKELLTIGSYCSGDVSPASLEYGIDALSTYQSFEHNLAG